MRVPLVLLAVLLAGCQAPGGSWPYDATERSAFGTILNATRLEDGAWRVAMDAEFVACERRAERWEGEVLTNASLAPGMRVGLQENRRSNTLGHWEDLAGYALVCHAHHEGDVRTSPLVAEAPPQGTATAVRLRGAPVEAGARTPVDLRLENRQDDALVVRLEDLRVVSDSAFQTSGWTGRVATLCAIEPASGEVALPRRGTAAFRVSVDCPEDADPRAPYPECERVWENDTLRPGECHDVEPQSTPLATVVGRLLFTDELGGEHARDGLLWQFLEVGLAARLEVDAPAEVARPEDFVVRARYVDAEGRPIEGASVVAALLVPDLADHRFSLAREGDAHVFRWSTMQEWTPRQWPSGDMEVVVEAEDAAGQHLARSERRTVRFA